MANAEFPIDKPGLLIEARLAIEAVEGMTFDARQFLAELVGCIGDGEALYWQRL